MHLEPALAFAELGYHIMLEKPMALDEPSCRAIVDAVERAGVILAVGHVLRYTPYTQVFKDVLDSGRLGDVVSVQHTEPVGHWHQAHSFVRGNWRRTDEATSMLMAKSCHDLDWLQYVIGQPPTRVSSFGRLSHFTPAQRPAGAADRCLDCSVETQCAFSAKRIYGERLAGGNHGWPLSAVVDEPTEKALDAALRSGPYGRCVYACDNDVVDHQVVAMEFAERHDGHLHHDGTQPDGQSPHGGLRHPGRTARRRHHPARPRLPHRTRRDHRHHARGRHVCRRMATGAATPD